MKFAATLALATAAIAAPTADLAKRQNAGTGDAFVLNFALTLEHLEAAFYREGLRRFGSSFADNSAFKRNIYQTGVHENQHVAILTSALSAAGASPVKECTYNFGNLDAQSFVATAAVLEGVGVAAYAGAAQLIQNKAYLTTAATILSVEARHSAYLRAALGQTPIPQTLDTAMTPKQVITLASQFITKCPSGSNLELTGYPRITATGSATTYSRGGQYKFNVGPKATLQDKMFCGWLAQTGTIYSQAYRTGGRGVRCVVPKGEYSPMGQTYVMLLKATGNTDDSNTIAGPGLLNVAAPFFVGAN